MAPAAHLSKRIHNRFDMIIAIFDMILHFTTYSVVPKIRARYRLPKEHRESGHSNLGMFKEQYFITIKINYYIRTNYTY